MLKELEDDLLSRLSSAGGNILGDTALVENLETTKRTAAEIELKVTEAKITSVQIDQAREHYRPAAARASLLYFILNELNTINPIYQFSLKVCVKPLSLYKIMNCLYIIRCGRLNFTLLIIRSVLVEKHNYYNKITSDKCPFKP